MERLREWISREAEVLGPEFLRVDGILNHRIDPAFISLVGEQLAARFSQSSATCVLTAEAAGNIVAYELARRLGICALYAKKGKASTMIRPIVRTVISPTKGTKTELAISADYLCTQDRIIVVDDFLYQGHTSAALADMVIEAGAKLVGFGFVIEKVFANGRDALKCFDVPIATLAPIESMNPEDGTIVFAEDTSIVFPKDCA
ncbi:xanthine phosphoribosyltransferase [Candidatus Bipolaricaulota bacterium]|nr:xanthine phosphoribosyltransferase [Candidatus Bipolaricaulota bacterium]